MKCVGGPGGTAYVSQSKQILFLWVVEIEMETVQNG